MTDDAAKPFAGQVALVTGAARRTGAAIAGHLATRGAAVVVHHHTSATAARELVERLGGDAAGCHAEAADLTDPGSVAKMVERIIERSGRIDLLVNNVGTFLVKPIERVDPAEWDRAVRTTVTAAFLVCRAVLPHMRRCGYGRIVNIADSAADKLSPQPTLAPYMVGKTGILILTKSLAATTADCDITVNAVSPAAGAGCWAHRAESRLDVVQSSRHGCMAALLHQTGSDPAGAPRVAARRGCGCRIDAGVGLLSVIPRGSPARADTGSTRVTGHHGELREQAARRTRGDPERALRNLRRPQRRNRVLPPPGDLLCNRGEPQGVRRLAQLSKPPGRSPRRTCATGVDDTPHMDEDAVVGHV